MLDEFLMKTIADRVATALEEDLGGYGDLTTNAIRPVSAIGTAVIRSKGEGILCGIEAARETFLQLDSEVVFLVSLQDGQEIHSGTAVLEVRGKYSALLKGERTALNFLAHLSGIATLTHRAVQAVKGTGVKIWIPGKPRRDCVCLRNMPCGWVGEKTIVSGFLTNS